jgi:excisionase family DNA binding protein
MKVREAAAYLGLHQVGLRKMITRGEIPAVRLGKGGRTVRIDKAALDRQLDSTRIRK